MQGRSAEYDATVVKSHIAVSAVDVIQDGKVVLQPQCHAGSVKADRMSDQMREFQVDLSDPDGTLTPEDMNSLLAPFGTRIQLFKGVRLSSTDTHQASYGSSNSWVPSSSSTGILNGTTVAPDGSLTLGP